MKTPASPRFSQRGQTMVLFVLSMLFVVLMVVLTLSFNMKVRERIEVQTVADAAAYTNAVATARTFNNIAVLNRAQIAHAVAQSGAQSLISWTTMYRAFLNAGRSSFRSAEWPYRLARLGCLCAPFSSTCAQACRCGTRGVNDLTRLQNALRNEDRMIDQVFMGLDMRAGLQLLLHQTAQLGIYASQQVTYQDLVNKLGDQTFAQEVADAAAGGGNRAEWLTPGGLATNRDEVEGGMFCRSGGAACELPFTVAHAVNAAMGSRGYRFVTHRNLMHYMPHFIRLAITIARSGRTSFVFIQDPRGTAYFKKPAFLGTMGALMNMLPPYGDAVTAQDEGSIFAIYLHIANGGGLPCPPVMLGQNMEAKAEVVGTGIGFRHVWTGGRDRFPIAHFLVPCTGGLSSCPGIWPAFIDYNTFGVMDQSNNFAQPKNFAVVQRDLGTRAVADPWNVLVNFRFEQGSPGARLDTRGLNLADGTPNNLQTALSTGIAYYHRGTSLGINHWAEPPNFMNPYWRATLVAPDVDQSGLGDAVDTLRTYNATAADTFDALRAAGYRGIQ
jgi:hypothetical protein